MRPQPRERTRRKNPHPSQRVHQMPSRCSGKPTSKAEGSTDSSSQLKLDYRRPLSGHKIATGGELLFLGTPTRSRRCRSPSTCWPQAGAAGLQPTRPGDGEGHHPRPVRALARPRGPDLRRRRHSFRRHRHRACADGAKTFIAIEVKYSEGMTEPEAPLRPRYDGLSRESGPPCFQGLILARNRRAARAGGAKRAVRPRPAVPSASDSTYMTAHGREDLQTAALERLADAARISRRSRQ